MTAIFRETMSYMQGKTSYLPGVNGDCYKKCNTFPTCSFSEGLRQYDLVMHFHKEMTVGHVNAGL